MRVDELVARLKGLALIYVTAERTGPDDLLLLAEEARDVIEFHLGEVPLADRVALVERGDVCDSFSEGVLGELERVAVSTLRTAAGGT